jgi:hypothetical protein
MTGLVKSLAVAPLVWTVEPTFIEAPVVVKLATKAVTFVPNGTVTAMPVPAMVPVDAGLVSENAVIAFAELKGLPPAGLGHAAKDRIRAAARKTRKADLEIRFAMVTPLFLCSLHAISDENTIIINSILNNTLRAFQNSVIEICSTWC